MELDFMHWLEIGGGAFILISALIEFSGPKGALLVVNYILPYGMVIALMIVIVILITHP